jgi:hypothetical protein
MQNHSSISLGAYVSNPIKLWLFKELSDSYMDALHLMTHSRYEKHSEKIKIENKHFISLESELLMAVSNFKKSQITRRNYEIKFSEKNI